ITPAQTSPSSLTSPNQPSSIRMKATPPQRPSVGGALNWQGQPQSQMQAPSSTPASCHSMPAIAQSPLLLPGRHCSAVLRLLSPPDGGAKKTPPPFVGEDGWGEVRLARNTPRHAPRVRRPPPSHPPPQGGRGLRACPRRLR